VETQIDGSSAVHVHFLWSVLTRPTSVHKGLRPRSVRISTGVGKFILQSIPTHIESGSSPPEVVVSATRQVSPKRIRIGVAEATRMGSQLIAEALKHRRNNFDVRAFAEESSRAFREIQDYEPHVAVISADLLDGPYKGFSVLDRMRASKAKAAAVMLLNSDERELVIDAFRGGARGIFCRGQSLQALPKCIRTVHQGQIWANNSQLEFLLQLITNLRPILSNRRGLNTLLTPRQREVVALVTEDMKNDEIALELGLKAHTVRNYLFQIFEKLGVSSRVGLVLYALGEPAINDLPDT